MGISAEFTPFCSDTLCSVSLQRKLHASLPYDVGITEEITEDFAHLPEISISSNILKAPVDSFHVQSNTTSYSSDPALTGALFAWSRQQVNGRTGIGRSRERALPVRTVSTSTWPR